MRLAALAILSTVLAGCASAASSAPPVPLTRAGEAVQVTGDPETVRGCEYVAEVPSAAAWNAGPAGQIDSEENPVRELRNTAASIGANFVLMYTQASPQRAEGYLCAD